MRLAIYKPWHNMITRILFRVILVELSFFLKDPVQRKSLTSLCGGLVLKVRLGQAIFVSDVGGGGVGVGVLGGKEK